MTFIPGTGKLKEYAETAVKKQDEPSVFTVVNVKEKKMEKEGYDPNEGLWYNQLKYWLLFGLALAPIFMILAVNNIMFLALIPIGPVMAACGWFVRKLVKKYGKNLDAFSSK